MAETPPREIETAQSRTTQSNRSLAVRLGVVLAAAGLALWVLSPAVDEAMRLFPQTLPANPYFVPEHFLLLYLKVPVVVLALILLLLMPGMCLALTARPRMGFFETLVKGFGVSTIAHICSGAVLKWTVGLVTPAVFLGWLYGFAIVSCALLFWIVPADQERESWSRARVTVSVCLCLVATVVFLPMIFWQDLTGDGAEFLFAAQSLDQFVLPRWPSALAVSSLGQGMLFQPIVGSWFMLVFGPVEASIRLPLVFFLPVLLAAVVLLIEHASPRRLTSNELWCVAACLLVFAAALVFNASYGLYSTDPASPGGMEYATVLGVLCTVYFLWTREWVWFAAFVTMGHFSRPTELLFLAALGFAAWLFYRPRMTQLVPIGIGLALAFVITSLLSFTYLAEAVAMGGRLQSPLTRYGFIELWSPQRIGMVAAGGGLLPIFAVAAYKWQDVDTRVLSVAWGLLFLAFYVPATYAVHHLAPVMVLPIVIFWRTALRTEIRARVPLSMAAAAVAFALALPTQAHFPRYQRAVAQSIRYEIGDVDGDYEERRAAVRPAREALRPLLPARHVDAATDLVPELLALVYYAQRMAGSAPTYVIIRPTDEPLAGRVPEGTGERSLVYVNDLDAWDRLRHGTFSITPRAALYALGPETLFQPATARTGNYLFAPRRLPLLRRFF